jgi:hypothetical protein
MGIQLLLTAVSYKPKGACIAGITTDGTFIRPGSLSQPDFSIPWSSIDVGPWGRKLQPLDVVTLEIETIADGHVRHFEDRQCRNAQMSFVTEMNIPDLAKKAGYTRATKPAWFMADSAPYVINAAPTQASLALVLADSIEIVPKPHDPSKHYISFTTQNRRFQSLSLTDLNHQRHFETVDPNAPYWLCMSLALDYSINGEIRNYKLVAGMWPANVTP